MGEAEVVQGEAVAAEVSEILAPAVLNSAPRVRSMALGKRKRKSRDTRTEGTP